MLPSDSDRIIHVVIAVADSDQRQAIADGLSSRHEVVVRTVENWAELKSHLDVGWPEVVILGTLSDESATAVNDRIKSHYIVPPSAIIVGKPSIGAVLKAFRCGFADFISTTPLSRRELGDAVSRAAIQCRRDRKEQYRIAQLEADAQRDSATGLPNSGFVEERMRALIRAEARRPVSFAILLLGVDKLDDLRATFGHRIADRVLFEFAKRLRSAVRESDTLARLDDDWFVLLVDRDAASETLEGARQRLARVTATELALSDVGLRIAAQIGVARFPENGRSTDELVRHAKGDAETLGDETPVELISDDHGGAGVTTQYDAEAGDTDAVMAPADPIKAVLAGTAGTDAAIAAQRERDRRETPRHRTYKRGTLILTDGVGSISCVVRDISEGGARVSVEGHVTVPRQLELLLPDTRQRRAAETRWRRGQEIGLQFSKQR